MSKVALINIGMHGHVNPTLGFTEALVRRGHEVLYFVDQSFAPQVERTGARAFDYGSHIGRDSEARTKMQLEGKDPFSGSNFLERFQTELDTTFPRLYDELVKFRPDVIVYGFLSVAGRAVAKRLKIPAVKYFTTYASNESYDLLRDMFGKLGITASPEETAASTKRLAETASEYAGEAIDPETIFNFNAESSLVFMPRRFQPHSETFDKRFHFVGPCMRSDGQQLPAGLLPPGDDPLLLVSLGTVFNAWPQFYQEVLTAFGNEPWRVVMSIGPHIDPKSLGELPKNVSVRPSLPQLALLKEAAVFVSHCGMNSTMEALAFGVPIVGIPQMHEQEVSAIRVAELGLGRHLQKEQVTAAALVAAVKEVHNNPQIQTNVERMQQDVLNAGGTARAVEVIEAAMRGRVAAKDSDLTQTDLTHADAASGVTHD